MLLGVDDLDDQRQVLGQLQQVGRVDDAARAEAGEAPQHGGPREALLAQALDQRVGEGLAVPAVALADEDAHQPLLAVEDAHAQLPTSQRPSARPSAARREAGQEGGAPR